VARKSGYSSPTRTFRRKRGNGEQGDCINSIRAKAVANLARSRRFAKARPLDSHGASGIRGVIEAIFIAAVLILAIAILAVIYGIKRDVPPPQS